VATALVDQLIEAAKYDLLQFYGEDNQGAILAVRTEFSKSQTTGDALEVLVRELRLEVLRGKYAQALKKDITKIYKSSGISQDSSKENTFSIKAAPIPGIEASFSRKSGKAAKESGSRISNNHELVNVIQKFLDKSESDNRGYLERTIGRLLNAQNLPSRVIFVVDRVESEATFELLQNLRMFDDSRITFFVIIPQEQYFRWSQEMKRTIDKLGFRSHYVPSLWEEKTSLIDQIISDAMGVKRKDQPEIRDFKDHVAYISRGAPGDAVREILSYEYTSYQFKVPKLMVDKIRNKKMVAYNARRQRLLAQNWENILGHRFISEEESDQAKVGTYELMDWIHEIGGFKLSALKETAANAFVPISVSAAKRDDTVEALLNVLVENHYLSKNGEQYQVIYKMKSPPDPPEDRTVVQR